MCSACKIDKVFVYVCIHVRACTHKKVNISTHKNMNINTLTLFLSRSRHFYSSISDPSPNTEVIPRAGTWSYEGATVCTPCWDNSWSLPGALNPFMCLCNAGYAFDFSPPKEGADDASAKLTCEVDVTTCDAAARACTVAKKVQYGEVACKDYAKCRVKRGNPYSPCVKCPANAVSEAGSRNIFDCKCKEVCGCVGVMVHMLCCIRAYVY
jgi:hypothetical protein